MIGPVASLPLVLVNGRPVPDNTAGLSTRDRGFTLADGLFETMRTHAGVVFRLEQHLSRLGAGLERMRIPPPASLRTWIADAQQLAGASDLSLRVTISRGIGPGGLAPPADVEPTTVITVSPLPPFAPSIYTQGLSAIIASGRRNTASITAGLKTLAYTDAVMAWLEARDAGADEAIFLDSDGHCSEATASNLFVVRDGTLVTPPLSCAVLPGITRAAVLELCPSIGVAAEQRPFDATVLTTADEVFLTSSLRGIAPVTTIGTHPIGDGVPGPITRRVAAAYQSLVEQECRPA